MTLDPTNFIAISISLLSIGVSAISYRLNSLLKRKLQSAQAEISSLEGTLFKQKVEINSLKEASEKNAQLNDNMCDCETIVAFLDENGISGDSIGERLANSITELSDKMCSWVKTELKTPIKDGSFLALVGFDDNGEEELELVIWDNELSAFFDGNGRIPDGKVIAWSALPPKLGK